MAKQLVVDADGHILEPLDLWERYLEPQYRDRAIRRKVNEKGYEYLEFDREPMFLPAGTMGGWGGAYMDINELMVSGQADLLGDAPNARRARIDPGRAGAGDGRAGNRRSPCCIPRRAGLGEPGDQTRKFAPLIAAPTTTTCSISAPPIPIG